MSFIQNLIIYRLGASGRLENLNDLLARLVANEKRGLDLEKLGLAFPITMEDIRENVEALRLLYFVELTLDEVRQIR